MMDRESMHKHCLAGGLPPISETWGLNGHFVWGALIISARDFCSE